MKRFLSFLLACVLFLPLMSCSKEVVSEDLPDDFCFSLVWNCYGDSTYDSKTGILVKQKVATVIENYTTTLFLTDEQKTKIYNLIRKLDLDSYPDDYNPIKGGSDPSRDIVLSVTADGKTKTITCKRISLGNSPNGSKGKKFMTVYDEIVSIITTSKEWLELPDYEFHYD